MKWKSQGTVSPLSLPRLEVDALYSLMDTGRKDFLWRSVLHQGFKGVSASPLTL